MRMRHIVICGLPRTPKFLHIISKRNDFPKKKNVIEHKMCILILSISFVHNISHSKKNWLRKYSPFLPMALQPAVGLGFLYNVPPGLSIPCSVFPFI